MASGAAGVSDLMIKAFVNYVMNRNHFSLRAFFLGLFENRRRQRRLSINDMESDTTGEPETDCNPLRSLVYEVKTESGWRVFRRPGK